MKENKEETKLQSEQKTAEEILKDFIRKETEYLQSCNPTNELGEITGNDFAAGLVRGMNKVLEEYASQFKSQLPINQNMLNLIKEADAWLSFNTSPSAEQIMQFRKSLQEVIAAESQPLPIEGVEREWISVKEREPETSGYYWCFIPNYSTAEQHTCFYNKSKGAWDEDGFGAVDVSHWMPLSSPPKNG